MNVKKISTRPAHAWEATFFPIRRFLHNTFMNEYFFQDIVKFLCLPHVRLSKNMKNVVMND